MAKNIDIQLPDELIAILQKGTTIGILATFSEKGLPNTMPIQWILSKGTESLLMTIHKDHVAYHNMVWQKKVIICFMGENNIAYSILGRVGVVRAPSMVNPLMNVVRIDIIEIKDDRSPLVLIEQGMQWRYSSPEAAELGNALMQELQELAGML